MSAKSICERRAAPVASIESLLLMKTLETLGYWLGGATLVATVIYFALYAMVFILMRCVDEF